MYIIDFDDTLFNTERFKHLRFEAIAPFGVSKIQYKETSEQARRLGNGLFGYTNERHAEILAGLGFDREKILEAFRQTSTPEVLQSLLNEAALDCISTLKATGRPLILLSLGDSSFQELKTKGSGLQQYFDRIFFVDDTKQHVLEELFGNHEESGAWFINDKVDETKELAARFPGMNIVLKKSERFDEKEYKDSGFPYFFTLKEIAAYVTT